MSNAIVVEQIGRSLIVRFTRPEIRNPLSISVLASLFAVTDVLPQNRLVERLIFTGTDGVFASGADLREIAKISPSDAQEFAERGQKLMGMIADLPQETIAAINGPCFGGALDLALACDRRFATEDSEFSHPGVGLGIITGWGGTQRLPRLIGESAALEMFLTAGRISAQKALGFGLIDSVVKDSLKKSLSRSAAFEHRKRT